MSLITDLQKRLKGSKKTIIFPESTDEKIIKAAAKLLDLEIAQPIFVGKMQDTKAVADKLNIDISKIKFVDHEDQNIMDDTVAAYLRQSDMYSEKSLYRKLKNPLNFAAARVSIGFADSLAAGISHTTGEVIMASQMYIGMSEGVETISSIGITEITDFLGKDIFYLGLTDCAVCMNPTSEELADIAIASSITYKSLIGDEPKAAMLSFSSDGSGEHEIVEKVVNAVKIANEKRPDLLIDGEFQLDTAIIQKVAEKKMKRESKVAGNANILVFPDLNAGNIGVKLIQIFGGVNAHGPMLQGFKKPVTDFSRSAPVEEIVGNLTMLVARIGG
ncbi:MAG: phosphate acyltransferase [Eubacteriales bacterium]